MPIENIQNTEKKTELQELRKYFFLVLRKWQWVIAFVLICLAIAWFVNRYTSPVYNIETTILSKKYERESARSAFDVITGDEYFSTIKDINRETTVLKSFPVVYEAIDRLDWKVSYFKKGG